MEVYVSTRSTKNKQEAKKNGAVWVGDALEEEIPTKLDSASVFPPAGALVEPALCQVKRGGILVLAPVSMSTIEIENYSKNLWGRDVRTLYNVKKTEGEEYLEIAGRINIKMGTQVFPFEQLQEAMILVKNGEIKEPNAVVKIADE